MRTKWTRLSISDNNLDLMLGSYMRYSLGRMSYIVDACCDTLEQYVPRLSEIRREFYITEIEKALQDATNRNTTLGMQMDHTRWQRCLERLKESSNRHA